MAPNGPNPTLMTAICAADAVKNAILLRLTMGSYCPAVSPFGSLSKVWGPIRME